MLRIGQLVVVILAVIQTEPLFAEGYRLLDLEYMGMTAAKFRENRDPMTPDTDEKDYMGRVAADFNVQALTFIYWKNNVHTEMLTGRVHTVGWHWELGIRLHPNIYPFYEHHSRHLMDEEQKGDQGYPVEDSFGLRFNFYENPKKPKNIFK